MVVFGRAETVTNTAASSRNRTRDIAALVQCMVDLQFKAVARGKPQAETGS
jgi:hypothetical protein